MLKIITLVVGLLFSTTVFADPKIEQQNDTKVIVFDLGGQISNYVTDIMIAKIQGVKKVKIGGFCASACILWLHKDFEMDVCALPSAAIGFHIPFTLDEDQNVLVSDEQYLQGMEMAYHMIDGLPDKLRQHWMYDVVLPAPSNGDPTWMMDWVVGKEAVEMVGACD